MVRHGMSRGVARRHRWTAAILAAVIGFPVILVQSTGVHVASAATTLDIRLDVVSARDSTLRPARGDDPCAPYRGMKLLTPFAEVGAPAGCSLARADVGAHLTNGSTTVADTHILATDIGATVTGAGIPAGATVASAITGVSFELSAAATSTVTENISLSRSNPAPFTYHWLINLDNTGDPHQASTAAGVDPGDTTIDGSDVCRPLIAGTNPDGNPNFPQGCNWPSIHSVQQSPIITEGDSTDWNLNGSLSNAMQNLPAGKYLVSVSADGFEIGGAHFTMPLPIVTAGSPGIITVGLNPYPIPLGTIQVKVFQDQAPADGTFDQTTEHGLQGWQAKVEDILPGNVATNWYGDPICSEYEREIPGGLLALAPPSPPENPMSPTQALAFYGTGGPGRADATAFYGGGDPNYVFSYTDYVSWGVALVGGAPQRIPGTGGKCLSDADGIVRIPDMGTNRYSITVTPPDDLANEGRWAQTTTLEGAHDSDFWLMANDSGLDSEMVQAGEPVPWAQFGFVDLKNENANGVPQPWPITADTTKTGEIKGTVMVAEPYVPGQGGLPGQGGANGQSGIRYPHTLDRVKIALNDFDNGDLTGYVTQNNSDGTFDIKHVKDGTYLMAFWDIDQDHAFDAFNVTIVGGQVVDLGNVPLIGWFTQVTGKVFIDSNANGKLDPGEQGVPNFDVTMKNRTNDMMVSGQNVATTNGVGTYDFKEAYPAGAFVIQEFFNTRYKTTGLTYQADNDPNEHTVLTTAVDISLLPIIGQNGRVDIGVLPYDTTAKPCADTCQGGIVATVVYDATRNELSARKAVTEPYETGIPGVPVNIAIPIKCPTTTPAPGQCDDHGRYQLNADGSFATTTGTVGPTTASDFAPGNVSDTSATYVSEAWHRPDSCLPRDSNGNVVQQSAMPIDNTNRTPHDCIEATELATTWGMADGTVGATDSQNVDGNFAFVPNHPGDYVISVDIPTDPIFHRPLYIMRDEAPVNVFTGDVYVPQDSNLTGTTYQSFLKFNRADPSVPQLPPGYGLREADSTASSYFAATCVGPLKTIYANDPVGHPDTYNPDLHNQGGSPWEGMQVHDCSRKLVHVEPGQSVAPNFNLWTTVPEPSKFWGYVTDDVSVSTDRRGTALGEVQGVANVPVGLYDWSNRLLYETDTDYNGLFEVLMPSTNSYNCPVPAGPCSGMYRFVGNDPGQPQHPNMNYNPVYRTIAANFQAWPGVFTSADTAPTRVMVQIEGPASQFSAVVICKAPITQPQIFHVDWPFVPNPNTYTANNGQATGRVEVYGTGFGTATGSISLTPIDIGSSPPSGTVTVSNWSDTHFTMTLQLSGVSSVTGGAYQLHVTNAGGSTTTNGLTIHVLKSNYTTVASGSNLTLQARFPDVTHVGPLSKLRLLDVGTNDLTPNAPYTNWGETNYPNMFTPTDPSKFYFPGPIQKAINYEWGRWLNVSPLLTALINAFFPVHNETWAAAMQAAGNSAFNQLTSPHKHPLIMVYPRFDQDPTTGAPATDPVTHAPSFDPNDPALAFNANGAYYESPVMFYPFKLQGTGPGGIYPDATGGVTGATPSYGTVVDGQYFNAATNKPEPTVTDAQGDLLTFDPSLFVEPYAALWENFVELQLGAGSTLTFPTIPAPPSPVPSWFGYGWDGQQAPAEGQVFYVLAHNGDYGTVANHAFRAAIDGLTITGGDQKGFPGNRAEVGGGAVVEAPGQTGTAPDTNFVLDIQGGAMMVNAFARYLQITNNSVIANSGASGAIRIGTPQLGTDAEAGASETDPVTGETFPAYDQQNTDVHIAYNRVVGDGGTSLGGALAIFNGSERYRVDHNQFCGNFSAEYGGAISHFGRSKNGEIDHNQIYLNESVDEGAGIMIGGEPQLDAATAIPIPGKLSNGSGPVSVHDNYIAANLAGDDGGGVRFLQAGNWQADVYNNMITDNVSTHEGGGIALDDSTNVRIYNNTVAKNITTATAVTATGAPAPAGLSTGDNSTPLMACVVTAPTYTHNNGQTTSNSATFTLPTGTPAAARFTAADLGATLVQATRIPAGAQIVSVAVNGLSVGLNVGATGTQTGLTYSVYRACDGMPPQAASPASFSNPLLFNDLFDDNRAGTWVSTGATPGVHGVGLVTVPVPETINEWDMGAADGSGLLSPTNSVINSTNGYIASPTNTVHTEAVLAGDPASAHNYEKFKAPFDISVSISPWRVNPRFRPTAIVGVSLPANAIGDYHLLDATSPAVDHGAASTNVAPFSPPTVSAPNHDIDNDPRAAPIDIGADELRVPTADLTVTKTHSPTGSVGFGAAVTYTVTVHNNGPDTATGAPVTDNFPAGVNVATWTCTTTAGSSCTTSGAGNSRGGTVTLTNGGTATYTASTTASPAAKALPALATLDNFNRANAANLGASWTQPAAGAIRVNTNQALCSGALACPLGPAYWSPATFGPKQGAAFTFASAPTTNSELLMAAGGTLTGNIYQNNVRVQYSGGSPTAIVNTASVAIPAGMVDPNSANNSQSDTLNLTGNSMLVSTTTTFGIPFTDLGSVGIPTGAFASGNTLEAVINTDGTVDIWKINGGTTYLGSVGGLPASFTTGAKRVGMLLPNNQRVDDFKGATVP